MATWLRRGAFGERGSGHGRTSTFPARRPSARPCMASRSPSSGTSSGSSSASTGSDPEASSSRARSKPSWSYVKAPVIDELVEQDAVGVEAGRLDAGADQHERAAADELGQPGLHGRAPCRSTRAPRRRRRRRRRPARPCRARRGRRGGAPGWRRPRVASAWRRSRGSAQATSSTPMRPQRGDARARRWGRRRARGRDWPGRARPWLMPWRATASGSASAAARGSSPSGIGSSSPRRRTL